LRALTDWRKLLTADSPDEVAPGHRSSDEAGKVGRVGKGEPHPGHVVANGGIAGRDDVYGVRMGGSNASGRVLELEAVAEDDVVTLRSVLPEVLLELGRRLRLDMARVGAKAIADGDESLVGSCIP
jgi:hypothetical protein